MARPFSRWRPRHPQVALALDEIKQRPYQASQFCAVASIRRTSKARMKSSPTLSWQVKHDLRGPPGPAQVVRGSCERIELLGKEVVVGAQGESTFQTGSKAEPRTASAGPLLADEDRQDNGAKALLGGLTDDTADRLHDIDLGAARIDESHGVQGGHVDTLGKAARVGQAGRYRNPRG